VPGAGAQPPAPPAAAHPPAPSCAAPPRATATLPCAPLSLLARHPAHSHLSLPSAPPRFFETFSYLPSLTEDQIARQVDYIVNNGWTPCLEFADPSVAYMSNDSVIRIQNGATPVSGLPMPRDLGCHTRRLPRLPLPDLPVPETSDALPRWPSRGVCARSTYCCTS
jgi:hypothetical protein